MRKIKVFICAVCALGLLLCLPIASPVSVSAAATTWGFLDGVNSTMLWGWAWDSTKPNTAIDVHIYIHNVHGVLMPGYPKAASANIYRNDLYLAGIGNGKHAFNYAINWADFPKGDYYVRAYAIDNASCPPLSGNPKHYQVAYKATINNYFDFGLNARVGPSVATSKEYIKGYLPWANKIFATAFNLHVTNNYLPEMLTSYADECHGGGSYVTGSNVTNPCPHAVKHKNTFNILDDFKIKMLSTPAHVCVLWCGHNGTYWGMATAVGGLDCVVHYLPAGYRDGNVYFSHEFSMKGIYLHEVGHCLGAAGDANCPSTSCIMSKNTNAQEEWTMINQNNPSNFYCSQCTTQIKNRIKTYW
jgi:hypothetical protein